MDEQSNEQSNEQQPTDQPTDQPTERSAKAFTVPVCPYCNKAADKVGMKPLRLGNYDVMQISCGHQDCMKVVSYQILVIDEPVLRPDKNQLRDMITRGLT